MDHVGSSTLKFKCGEGVSGLKWDLISAKVWKWPLFQGQTSHQMIEVLILYILVCSVYCKCDCISFFLCFLCC